MKKITTLLFLVAAIFAAQAQDRPKDVFGIRAGLNLSNLRVDEAEAGMSPKSLASFHVGGSWQHLLTPSMPLYLETGLYISQKGCKVKEGGFELTIKPLYMQVPVLAVYRFETAAGISLQPFLGPYVAYGLSGKAKVSMGDYSSKADLFKESNYEDSDGDPQPTQQLLKRFDAGLRLGVGATWNNLYFSLGYDLGLTDNVKEDEYGVVYARNRTFTISAGYNF